MGDGDDDLRLLEAWRDGDARAGDELVRRHYRVVYDFLFNKITEDRDDLAQRIFLGCIENVARLREGGRFKAYLLSIARFQLVDYYRRRSRSFEPTSMSIERVAGSDTASAAMVAREQQRALLLALRRLPFDLQLTVELHYWEAVPLAEIASITEVPVGTVKSRLARARDVLRRELEHTRRADDPDAALDFDAWARALAPRSDG